MVPQHILLASDFSPEASRSFDSVAALAHRLKARVTLLHVVPESTETPFGETMSTEDPPPKVAARLEEARAKLDQQRSSLDPDIDVEVEVVFAPDFADAIADFANQHDVDLIAMSTHGHAGFKHLVLGSVAEGVLQKTKVPVLCFPRDSD